MSTNYWQAFGQGEEATDQFLKDLKPVTPSAENIISQAKKNSEKNNSQDLSFSGRDFNINNPEHIYEIQSKLLGMKEGDAGWGTFGPKTTEAYHKYTNTFQESDNIDITQPVPSPVKLNEDGSAEEYWEPENESVEMANNLVESSTNISDDSATTPNIGGKEVKPNFLANAWNNVKNLNYNNIDENIFKGKLPFGPKPHEVGNKVDSSVDGHAAKTINNSQEATESNETVATAGGEESPLKSAFSMFKFESPTYSDYKVR
tara:strand:+ start:2836 stop:3615 length:780 start_codon:yes stop_codon:yes gene_type:complete